jgi:hypothetical protein
VGRRPGGGIPGIELQKRGELPVAPSSRKDAQEYSKLSVLDVYRLSHSRLQLDHLAIHSEPAVSVMVDGVRILLRRIGPGLEHFKDEEIVLVDEAGTTGPDWESSGGPGAMHVHHLVCRRP